MERRGLDSLVIRGISSKWDSGTANIRYISQVGGNGEEAMAVFSLKEDPVIFIYGTSQIGWWKMAQDWVKDIRQGSPSWSRRTVECVKELGHERGRIGVVGVGGHNLAGKCMSYDIYTEILEGLPEAHFEPASDILESLRIVKSEEEVEYLRRAAELCDVAIDAMLEAAKPGAKAYEVYGKMIGAVHCAGGESPMFLMYEADPHPFHALRFPSDRALEPGYMIIQEVAPKFAGYWSQAMVPVSLGEPPPLYRQLAEVAIEGYNEGINAIRPGITRNDLADAINRPIREAGFTWYRPQFAGLGLEQSEAPNDVHFGDRGSDLRAYMPDAPPEIVLKEGMVIGMQPMAATENRAEGMQVGDALVVTKDGARRLGKSRMELYVL